MKNNIKNLWWKAMVYERSDIEGIDASILMHPRIWEASGHVEGFTDPLVDCKKCKNRFKADQLEDPKQCPICKGELTQARNFNLMFKTFMGPVEDTASVVYLRPETAQGIYVNFHNVRESSRRKIPFGIAQIGKAFRNEITPGNFTFRTREFEQMEMQYFVNPKDDEKYFEYWKEERIQWYQRLGIKKENLQFHEHDKKELAHYAKKAFDIQYEFPFGWQEIEGIHNRTDYDLSRHQEFSGKDLRYFDDINKARYIPYIIETSIGCDRTLLTALIDAYDEEEDRVILHLSPAIAPTKVAIFPLVKRDSMPEISQKIANDLKGDYRIFYDESGSIGRRYRRQDEAGTPYCVTIDSDTLMDGSVTIRERDSMKQERIDQANIKKYLAEKLRV
jgi:glycyl-tRNA synthetase